MPSIVEPPPPTASAPDAESGRTADAVCFHCGLPCGVATAVKDGKPFCCHGCLAVHEVLSQSGLGHFYELNRHPGTRVPGRVPPERFAFLDDPGLQEQLLDFTDGHTSRVTFRIPAIHCVACVWLLENLFRLHPGVTRSVVNFTRREVSIGFAPETLRLSELVGLLTSIGYEPSLTLGELEKAGADPVRRRLHLQTGVAGFAFGNIMLFSLPLYLGLDSLSGPLFQGLFGALSLLLGLPVLVFSAADYFRLAWLSFRQRRITLEVPIAAGLLALYGQSAFEILSGRGAGYLDSLAGLVFFLLCGRIFQAKTYDRLAFDADYRSFFPLSATRLAGAGEESVALSALGVGDRLRVRHGELVPADARLVSGPAQIDYSFVTGEAAPVARAPGDRLYAGGRQVGGAIEVETVKPVSQSYLTSLWSQEAFAKESRDPLNTLTNRYGSRFTLIVVAIALAALGGWALAGEAARGLKALASVLIVACPCALALAAPFTWGTAQRLLGRAGIFLKNPLVLERLARVHAIVFDKTGTLTVAGLADVQFVGSGEPTGTNAGRPEPKPAGSRTDSDSREPAQQLGGGRRTDARRVVETGALTLAERQAVHSLARQSTHPYSVRIGEVTADGRVAEPVSGFVEIPGCGIEGAVHGRKLLLGSGAWVESRGVAVPVEGRPAGSAVHLAIDGRHRGAFVLTGTFRPGLEALLAELRSAFPLTLLSGDNEQERERFATLLGPGADLRFNQTPLDKLRHVSDLRATGQTVMVVGDGLNDAGALRQADVGVAVVEKVGAFSPASDVIADGSRLAHLGRVLRLARQAERVVKLNFAVSALYNAVGIGVAATGLLSPVICALLMPLSSITVVTLASGATTLLARRLDLAADDR